MLVRDFYITMFCALIALPFALFSLHISFAQVRQSTNYKIQSDSINFGGGLSTSTSYRLESTAGEVATGDGSSTSYNLRGGYQQLSTTYIALSAPSPVVMTPSIPGLTGGTANGSTTVIVTTDSPAGYSLSIKASASPAMQSGSNTIADYVPSGNPDFTFTVGTSSAVFGYSPSSVNTVNRFRDNGSVCNAGAGETLLACWDGLSTVDTTISQSSSANTPNGATTTVYFRVGIGSDVGKAEGVYVATTTLTALSL